MSKKIPQAAHNALQTVLYRESQLETFSILMRPFVQEYTVQQSPDSTEFFRAVNFIYMKLNASLNEAYRNLLVWLHISPESLPEEARVAVVNRFTGSNREIMSSLINNLALPGKYLASDHDEFRKELDDWLAKNLPKTKE